MGKEATAYIFSFDSKSGVFTLTSSKDQLTINSKHKKYEWLKGQEAGRIIKISATGRWNSSRDYNDLYKSIKPKKKAESKSRVKSNKSIDKGTKQTVTNSQDLNELKSEIEQLKSKYESIILFLEKNVKEAFLNVNATISTNNEKTFDAIESNSQAIQSIRSTTSNLAELLKFQVTNAEKLKPVQEPAKMKYAAQICATYKYESSDKKYSENLSFEIVTEPLSKKPKNALFTSYLRLACQEDYYNQSLNLGLPISAVNGLRKLEKNTVREYCSIFKEWEEQDIKNKKMSNIEIISIEEY